ncbi:hypothetical protein M885DRAFT_548569 [Pelagophyceae sp. CCMP2097]|nr:hypothetical protein M885DRAFT_548569 [Pelagophyceae sp. CCMP2097]|mmetsp:Transcript_1435/g.5299  ORF Transcript_1435/g.5299 Transcript_1435/m.5299 type:complete len:381 (-) Transcript_1435:249-1391(-)
MNVPNAFMPFATATDAPADARMLCGLPMTVLQDYLTSDFDEPWDAKFGDAAPGAAPAAAAASQPVATTRKRLVADARGGSRSDDDEGDMGAVRKKGKAATSALGDDVDGGAGDDLGDDLGDDDDDDDAGAGPDDGTARSAKSRAQVERRRDRNRILARRTRLRKKFFFESLQLQVSDLERENSLLKELVRTDPALQADAAAVLASCTTELPAVVTENRARATDLLNAADVTLMNSLRSAQRAFCITDPSLRDNPIVYASASFLSTTGFSLENVIGRNCRFLQGPGTDAATVAEISRGVREGLDTSVTILNYKADGTPFWNQLFVAALRDINKRVVNYVGVQIPVPGPTPEPRLGVGPAAGAVWPAPMDKAPDDRPHAPTA